MIKNKLRYILPKNISGPELAYIQSYVSELFEDGTLEDCNCKQIRVLVSGRTPLHSHFSARFECDCGKERVPINKKLIDS